MRLELDCGSAVGGDTNEMNDKVVTNLTGFSLALAEIRQLKAALRECVETLEGIHGGTLNISKAADYLRIDTTIKRAKELL